MTKATMIAVAAVLCLATSTSAWEIVSRTRGSGITPDSQGIKSYTPASIIQHSYNQGSPVWEYFTLYISSTGERHVIMFYDLSNASIQDLVKQFRDAYNYGKKVKWCRNVDSATEPASGTSTWQGYHTVQYPVRAGNKLDVIFG
jgi:hypothetical protein